MLKKTFLCKNLSLTNWKRISNIEVTSAVKNWLFGSKDLAITMNHGFNDVPVDFSWALIRGNGDIVVMNISSWHVNLNMIGT